MPLNHLRLHGITSRHGLSKLGIFCLILTKNTQTIIIPSFAFIYLYIIISRTLKLKIRWIMMKHKRIPSIQYENQSLKINILQKPWSNQVYPNARMYTQRSITREGSRIHVCLDAVLKIKEKKNNKLCAWN